jgi:hypothetical protein
VRSRAFKLLPLPFYAVQSELSALGVCSKEG